MDKSKTIISSTQNLFEGEFFFEFHQTDVHGCKVFICYKLRMEAFFCLQIEKGQALLY